MKVLQEIIKEEFYKRAGDDDRNAVAWKIVFSTREL